MAFIKGHYIDSGLSQEERNKLEEISKEESKKLKSWNEAFSVCEDNDEE